jgi:hypothetical protein
VQKKTIAHFFRVAQGNEHNERLDISIVEEDELIMMPLTESMALGGRHLVHALEWRDGLALIFVERRPNDPAILDVDVGRLGIMLERKGVLHPVLIITLLHEELGQMGFVGHGRSKKDMEPDSPPGNLLGHERPGFLS